MNAEKQTGPARVPFLRWSCIIFDGVIAVLFIGKGVYYALRPEIQNIGFAPQFFLAHLAVALLMVLGAVLLAKRKRGAGVVQTLAFLVIFTIVVVTVFFNPAHDRTVEASRDQSSTTMSRSPPQ